MTDFQPRDYAGPPRSVRPLPARDLHAIFKTHRVVDTRQNLYASLASANADAPRSPFVTWPARILIAAVALATLVYFLAIVFGFAPKLEADGLMLIGGAL